MASSGAGLLPEAEQAPVGRALHEAIRPRIVDGGEEDGVPGGARLMKGAHGREIGVGEHVPVEDEDGPLREVRGVPDAAPGAQRLLLHGVAQGDPEVAGVAERPAHVVHPVGARQDDVADPVLAKEGDLVGEEGVIEERDHRFGSTEGERSEPRALSAGEDDGLGRYRSGTHGSGLR